ncbi:FAD-dependent oxidoreductase, partial [Mycobacterium tuberculosis]|nr:FAD-dependent oxidoreductase [Mycobacterium tuberculosis]
ADLHARNGTELILGVGVSGLRTSGGDAPAVTGVELADGRVLDADLVIVGVGAAPSTQWLADTDIALNGVDGGIECSEPLAVLDTGRQPIPGL